jgi:hypothetical protein
MPPSDSSDSEHPVSPVSCDSETPRYKSTSDSGVLPPVQDEPTCYSDSDEFWSSSSCLHTLRHILSTVETTGYDGDDDSAPELLVCDSDSSDSEYPVSSDSESSDSEYPVSSDVVPVMPDPVSSDSDTPCYKSTSDCDGSSVDWDSVYLLFPVEHAAGDYDGDEDSGGFSSPLVFSLSLHVSRSLQYYPSR